MQSDLQPEATPSGVFVGAKKAPYEMNDRKGTYYRLYLATGDHGAESFNVEAIKVPAVIGEQVCGLKPGTLVAVSCSGFARVGSNNRPFTEWTARSIADAKSGEVLVQAPSRSAA